MRKSQSGFTLMEILIAVAVLAIGVVSVVNLFPVGLQAARRTADFSNTAVLAQKALDFYRSEGYEYVHDMYLLPGNFEGATENGDAYIPAPAGAGGMAGSRPFAENEDFSWRIVISEEVDHMSEDGTEFHSNAEIYRITLYIYWLDRGREQFDEFVTYIANYGN